MDVYTASENNRLWLLANCRATVELQRRKRRETYTLLAFASSILGAIAAIFIIKGAKHV